MLKLNLLSKALKFAAHKHRNQRRKDQMATPYINHPIELLSILAHEAQITDLEVLIAALLHDTIEDTDTQAQEIETLFGARVRKIVEEVTDDQNLTSAERKRLQVVHASTLSPQASMVKIADKIANLRDLETSPPAHWSEKRKADYKIWAREVIDQIKNPHPQLKTLFDELF